MQDSPARHALAVPGAPSEPLTRPDSAGFGRRVASRASPHHKRESGPFRGIATGRPIWFESPWRYSPLSTVTVPPVADQTPRGEPVRAAEVIGALCLATDLGMGFPFEHGLQSTVIAMRLAERLGADDETRRQTYYACLLSHSGCTTDAHVTPQVFGDSVTTHLHPVMYGSARQVWAGLLARCPTPTARVRCERFRPPAACHGLRVNSVRT